MMMNANHEVFEEGRLWDQAYFFPEWKKGTEKKYLFKQLVGKWERKFTVLHEQQLLEQIKVSVDVQVLDKIRHDSRIYQGYPRK